MVGQRGDHGFELHGLIVSARSGGDRRDTTGISLFVVDAGAEGDERRDYRTVDCQRAANIISRNVRVPAPALLSREGTAIAQPDFRKTV